MNMPVVHEHISLGGLQGECRRGEYEFPGQNDANPSSPKNPPLKIPPPNKNGRANRVSQ